MRIIKDGRIVERLVYWAIWLVILFLPLLFWDYNDLSQRHRIVGGWIRIIPFLLVFILHNQILFPKLLLNNRRKAYFVSTILIVLVVNYLFIYGFILHEWIYKLFGMVPPGMGMEELPHPPMPEPNPHHLMHSQDLREGGRNGIWHMPLYMIFAYNVIISILVIGFNASMKITSKWLKDEQSRKELEKENIQSKLTFLQNQVSPHFFMNTLNNIHALIDYSKKDAKDAVLRLSKMMRYLLYDSERGRTTLQKEIEFLNSYIDLMRLRLTELVELNVEFPKKIPHWEMPPFLFLSFVENAFKYGISSRDKSYIHIHLEITGSKAHFNIKNSSSIKRQSEIVSTGIGIKNARKRMDLLFGENFSLNVYNRENEYEVDLIFPFYED
jgi:hypothetical protein